ncbi:hypothetical protein P7H74_01530 [Enterococcus devriesei]|nr:hypothetical protein [Enterococcus devriesei]MDT2820433.1 hypothetical protein [Enterococcus devriesei]
MKNFLKSSEFWIAIFNLALSLSILWQSNNSGRIRISSLLFS